MSGLVATTASELQAVQSALRPLRRVALLGPEGTWTHQAALDLWPGADAPQRVFADAEAMPGLLERHDVDAVMLPARTRLVGATPYLPMLESLLAHGSVTLMVRYARMLGYSLLACEGARLESITQVLAHPVALEEAQPWLARHLPEVRRVACASAGDAAQQVAMWGDACSASLGPCLAGAMHGLATLVSGIEEGPHNVTEWWVLGYATLPPAARVRASSSL